MGGVNAGETQVMGWVKGRGGGGVAVGDGGRSEMEIQRAVHLHQWQNQLDCQSHAATGCTVAPSFCVVQEAAGCAACTEVHCGSGRVCGVSFFFLFISKQKGSVSGLHAQPSQWRSFPKKKKSWLLLIYEKEI